MPTTVAMRLCGTQSWGSESRHEIRETQTFPTKSGITGLVCNALGADRTDTDTIAKITAMIMSIRIDSEPTVTHEVQIIQNAALASNPPHRRNNTTRTIKSTRSRLDGACYLVLLTGNHDTATTIANALDRPKRTLSLGRKAYTAPRNISLGLHPTNTDPLTTIPGCEYHHNNPNPRYILETTWDDPNATITHDTPTDFTRNTPNTARPILILT